MNRVIAFLKRLTTATEPEKPEDLRLFEEARARLHKSSRALARETDVMGTMVRDMQGVSRKPRKKAARARG